VSEDHWLPDTSWPPLAPFWEGLHEGELRFLRCNDCGHFQLYPQVMCPQCRRSALAWVPVGNRGSVYTYTVLHRSFLPVAASRLPLIIAFVEITGAPGPRLVTNLVSCAVEDVHVGMGVEIFSQEVAPNLDLPLARPAKAS
jgi:uncharacterized OB-fold protein